MLHPYLVSPNRKLPLLPDPHTLPPDDPRHWAILFTRARLRKGWTLTTLATHAGTSYDATLGACTTGRCHAATILRLAHALHLPATALP